MANNTTKKAGSNKSFIDRMGGQKFIVLLVVTVHSVSISEVIDTE